MDMDILVIDQKIKKKFLGEQKELPKLTKNLEELYKTYRSEGLSDRIKQIVGKNIEELNSKILNISNMYDYDFYIAETSKYIEEYKIILKTPIKMSFMGKKTKSNKKKKEVINKYLEKAQKYTSIKIEFKKQKDKMVCNNCDNKKFFDVEENCIYICVQCGSQQQLLSHTSSYKDINRVNISSKYTYDRKVHFRDCINQYQGKQNSTIDVKVYIDLEDQFGRHHLLITGENVSKKKRFSKITKYHIHLFLKELDYAKHFENINLIYYNMTGRKLDDISYIEDMLLGDFDTLATLYDKMFKNKPGFDRKNFINTQYVLYQLLLKNKHQCKKEDFTILKTVDRKSFHDNVMKQLFSTLGWSFHALF